MSFCVYSGTFNPVHNAHIKVAEGVLENFDIEKIIFIPSYLPPHKDFDIIDPFHRLNMLKLACSNNENFEISDIEIKLKGKSYSYNTVSEIKKQYKITERINFLIGTDAFEKFDSWYKAEELADLIKFIVIPRSKDFDIEKSRSKIKLENICFTSINLPFIDISSSEIREKIKQNKPLTNLVSEKVKKYILEHNLYR